MGPVPQPGPEPRPLALGVESHSHWTTRKSHLFKPDLVFVIINSLLFRVSEVILQKNETKHESSRKN